MDANDLKSNITSFKKPVLHCLEENDHSISNTARFFQYKYKYTFLLT